MVYGEALGNFLGIRVETWMTAFLDLSWPFLAFVLIGETGWGKQVRGYMG